MTGMCIIIDDLQKSQAEHIVSALKHCVLQCESVPQELLGGGAAESWHDAAFVFN